jgi:hypothetical protein
VLFSQGPCGNINPHGESEDPEPMRKWGDELAQCVRDALSKAEPIEQAQLRSLSEPIDLPTEPMTKEIVARYADEFRALVGEGDTGPKLRMRGATDAWQQDMNALIERNAVPGSIPMEVQIIGLGPLRFVFMGAEVFSRMAEQLRSATGVDDLYVVAYANGDFGYLAPSPSYDEGGYEVAIAFMFYNLPPVRRGGFELARDRAAEIVRKLGRA